MNKYHFKFRKGFDTIKELECLFSEARKIGNDLANEHGKIECLAFNDATHKWNYLGEFIGNMNAIDPFGCLCRISDDFQRLIAIEEGGDKMTRWRAVDGETYFFITFDMKVDSMTEVDDGIDALAYNSGNYFETEAEAEEVAEKFRAILKEHHEAKEGGKK